MPYDTNRFRRDDMFVRDQAAGTTTRVSVKPLSISQGLTQCNSPCTPEFCSANPSDCNANHKEFMDVAVGHQAISADGRYVVFRGGVGGGPFASAPCTGTYLYLTVFVADVDTGGGEATKLADYADGCNGVPAISGDGSTIAFLNRSSNGYFQTSPAAGALRAVNPVPAANAGYSYPILSADGARLAFSSSATNVVAGDINAREDVFAIDGAVAVSRLSLTATGGQANAFPVGGGSSFPALSSDGTLVAFASVASDLVAGDTNAASDVFVRASRLLGGPLTQAEVLGGSNPSERCAQAIRCHADPVDTSTGNFFETFDDLSVAGRGIPLSFRRTYNAARAAVEGPLGFGWTHSYDMALSVSGTRATIRQENASEVSFVASGTAWVPAAPRVLASLARNTDGTWTFTRRNREIILFDATGRLVSLADRNNNTTTLAYPDPDTVVVSDPAGRTMALAHFGGRLQSVTDPMGRVVGFDYDAAGRLEDIAHAPASAPTEPFTAFAYTRDGNDALASVASTGVSPDDHGYVYDELQRLAGVDDTTLAYDAADNLTQLADDTFQGFDAANQLCYAVSGVTPEAATTGDCATPPAGATTFAYDARGNRTSATPSTGSSSTYAYDQANRLVAATAPGATTAVAAGATHSLALRSDASVAAWGDNASGQLGDATTVDRLSAAPVAGITGASAVAAGSRHSLAVVASGEVRAWGDNTSGKLGDDTTTTRLTPVAVAGLSGTTAVAAGANHSLALRSDGTVWAWGRNTSGQLGDGTTTARKTPVAVPGLGDVVAIAAGHDHSLALRGDGSVVAWGLNDFGQLGDGTTTNRLTPVTVPALSGITAVAAGASHSLALRSDASVWTWGRNANGQLGDGTTTSRVSPAAVSAVSGADAIAAGANHSLASTGAGALAWGRNDFGQLGDGSVLTRRTPMAVTGLTGAETLAAGPTHTLAAVGNGATASWGRNDQGQLGDGSLANRSIPGEVNGLTGGTETTYAYDGDGLRTAKTTAQATTAFTWDRSGGLPLLVGETTGTAATRYLYGPGDMPLARIDAAGEVVYYHGDQLGSTRALSDAAGEVVGTFAYDPYGNPTSSSGNVSQPFGFAGQYTDAETGFQYLRARYYDPATAQFLTRDPLVARSGQPYAYANNSPHNFTDPSGQIAWLAVVPLVWGAIELGGAVIDGVSTAKTLTDPCASGWDKAVSGGLFAFGAMAPGFGYSTGGRVAAEAGTPLSRVDRAGSVLKDDPFHRSVSWVVDNPAAHGSPSPVVTASSVSCTSCLAR